MNYFSGLTTVEDIKKAYRKLAMQNHPDRGGDVEVMKEINAQYQTALKSCDKQTTGDHTYYYNEQTESDLMDKIAELLALNMIDVDVALIGTWIWITGTNTKAYKENLKELGCRWHGKRKCWYFQNSKKRKSFYKGSLSDIASKYGYKSFSDNNTATAIA